MFHSTHTFSISGKTISIYPAGSADMPVIYLNTVADEGGQIYELIRDSGCGDFNFVFISGLDWHHDMSPWEAPAVYKGGEACTGGADEYLQLLEDVIIPRAEGYMKGEIAWRGIAGYSLAGLFAVYSMYRTTLFSRAASMSGSLWFPNFKEYVFSHEMAQKPDYLYFSLGDKENRTRNPYMKTVKDNTIEIENLYREQGIHTTLKMNSGGHFDDMADRTAAGIISCLFPLL